MSCNIVKLKERIFQRTCLQRDLVLRLSLEEEKALYPSAALEETAAAALEASTAAAMITRQATPCRPSGSSSSAL